MSGFPIPFPIFQAYDNNGDPLNGGLLYAYAAGTSTPLDTYSDAGLTTPNSNPVVLDGNGRFDVFIPSGTGYKFILKDSVGNTIWTVDNVQVPAVPAPSPTTNIPTGGILMYGAAVAPSGYLLCDGSAVSRTTYSALFAAIGTTYGIGNGSTTFNVPDYRQRFPLGLAASGTGSTLGATGGAIDHVHSGPSHTHTIAAHTHTIAHTHSVPHGGWTTTVETPPLAGLLQAGGTGSGSETQVTQATADNTTGASSAANSGSTALTTDAGGTGNTGTANPPFLTSTFIIKT